MFLFDWIFCFIWDMVLDEGNEGENLVDGNDSGILVKDDSEWVIIVVVFFFFGFILYLVYLLLIVVVEDILRGSDILILVVILCIIGLYVFIIFVLFYFV